MQQPQGYPMNQGYVPTQPVPAMNPTIPSVTPPMVTPMPAPMPIPTVQPVAAPVPQPGMPPMVPMNQPPMAPMNQPPMAPMNQPPAPVNAYTPQAVPPQPTVPYSTHLDIMNQFGGLFVQQKIEMLEAFTGFETENRYEVYLTGPDCVRGASQQPYFIAKEHSECCERQCCGSARSFNMTIEAPDGQSVLFLQRPFTCTIWCFNRPRMTIVDANNNKIGTVVSPFECCGDKFTILDHNDNPMLSIHGDCCQWGKCCMCPAGPCREITYDITNPETGSTGYIKKVWSGAVKELFTDADSFCLSFPADATIYQKILLLGAVFLVDFLFFENNDNGNRNSSV